MWTFLSFSHNFFLSAFRQYELNFITALSGFKNASCDQIIQIISSGLNYHLSPNLRQQPQRQCGLCTYKNDALNKVI
jgi:hypothetical protein